MDKINDMGFVVTCSVSVILLFTVNGHGRSNTHSRQFNLCSSRSLGGFYIKCKLSDSALNTVCHIKEEISLHLVDDSLLSVQVQRNALHHRSLCLLCTAVTLN